jgi:signal transduction histidine kinase
MRVKILVIMVLVAIANVLALYGGSQLILLRSFASLEEQNVKQNVERAMSVLSNEFAELSSKTGDYAEWDDTYVFVQDANEDYIQANLDAETFANLRVDVVLFINTLGELVFGKTFHHNLSESTIIPPALSELLSNDDLLWNHSSTDSRITGFVPLEIPLMVSSRPILTNNHEGPIAGALVFGRYLHAEEIDFLAQTVHLQLSLDSINDSQAASNDYNVSSALLEERTVLVQPLNVDSIAGYTLIADVYQDPYLVLRIEMPRDVYKQGEVSITYFLLSLCVTGMVFAATAMLMLEKQVMSRLERLAAEVRNIGKSRSFSERLSWNRTDELSILADAIDNMMEERLNTIERMAAMVGHDLRNPLTGISNAAYYLRMKINPEADPKAVEMLDIIERDVGYSNNIVNDLLEYSREIRLELTETCPKAMLKDSLALVKIPPNVQILDFTDDKPVMKADVDKMKRVFVNLVKNSIEAMPKGGTLTVKSKEAKGRTEITLADTGAGIPKDSLDKLFSPLFTTKAKGMGFGLAICKRVVEAHGGRISAESTVGKGTAFTITMPTEPKLSGGESL